MYAFYSLLVYIFYTVFKKEEEEALEGACGATSEVNPATSCRASGVFLSAKNVCMYHLNPESKDAGHICIIALQLCACLCCMQCVHFLCMYYCLIQMSVAVLRSQHLFPWKQGAGREMATPPTWEKRLMLGLVSQVSAEIALEVIYSQT